MESSNSFLFISLLSLAIICIIYCRKKLSYWSSRGIEQLPAPHWLFGHYKEGILFQASPGWHLGQLYKQAPRDAPLVGFYIFHKPCLLLKDPKIIKQILIKDFNKFPDRHFAGNTQKDSIGLRNLFAVRGKDWKYMKQKMGPVLNKSFRQMLPLMTEAGEPMLRHIDLNKGKELDVQDLVYKSTADLIASVAMGTKIDSFSDPNGELPRRMSEYFYSFERMLALVSVFFMPDAVDSIIGSLLFFKSHFIRKVFWTAMEERKTSGEERGDFVDFAKKMQNEPQSPYEFSGDNLIHQAGTFFSGFESSAATAAFTLMQLARNRSIQERARADVQRAVQKHGWTYEAFVDMRYLQQCLQETMRIHPQVSTLDRVGREDYQIPNTNITIKKGTAVYISIYGLHEDPQHFADPGTFDPGRFDQGRGIPEAYMPFGAGPRMCLGMKIGYLHAKVATAMVLASYGVYQKLEERLILDPRSTFTAASEGLKLRFRKLDDKARIPL
ncbi:cytochrome P450 6k1-like [Cydia splendana]|uniref:cytochrome P450 6k1-like n=1 Tax=Cydia splendana TaxID=1100963 RepID=UPI00300D1BD1